jgi:starvation-inducible outer membrane lipoprotein
VEVLLLVTAPPASPARGEFSRSVAADVARLGGRVLTETAEVGYLRIEIAPEGLLELVAAPAIEAYQIGRA